MHLPATLAQLCELERVFHPQVNLYMFGSRLCVGISPDAYGIVVGVSCLCVDSAGPVDEIGRRILHSSILSNQRRTIGRSHRQGYAFGIRFD
jgi:hypothetical protein